MYIVSWSGMNRDSPWMQPPYPTLPSPPKGSKMTVSNPPSSTTNKVLGHPLNAWYVAAWDHEVTRKPMARRIADRPLALYRTEDGKAVALADACWHRLAPLSMGKTVGKDGIQCPYHGIVYNSAGRCASMPAQETHQPLRHRPVLPGRRAPSLCLGLAGRSDQGGPRPGAGHAPDGRPDWAGDGETIYAPCNYQLVLDNLMDLTHEEFVHASSIGQEELSESEFVVTHDDNTVTVSRWMLNIDAPPFWLKNMRDKFPGFEGKVDRWQIIRFEAPSTIRIDVGVAKAGTGAPEGDRSQGVNGYVMNTISPETDKILPLLLGLHAQLSAGQPAHHHATSQRRPWRVR